MERITITVRPDQMETIITALRNAADDERQEAEILAEMRAHNKKERLAAIQARQDKYARTAAWLQHIGEEAQEGAGPLGTDY